MTSTLGGIRLSGAMLNSMSRIAVKYRSEVGS